MAKAKFRGILQNNKAEDPFGRDCIYNLALYKFLSAYSNISLFVKPGGYHSTPLTLSSSLFLKILTDYNPLPKPIASDLSVLQPS